MPLSVLIVEDEALVAFAIELTLAEFGFDVVGTAATGAAAVDMFERRHPDVVLMDVMMPQMDGLEALAAIRLQEQATGIHLPVIMATAHDEPGDRARYKKAGADGYVAKPIDQNALQAELQRVLGG